MNKLMTKRLTGQLSLHSRRPLMTNESGRSMVEMLGVLAIVGVLSAAALSGYSKAMMKYRSNKQLEQYNQLVTAIVKYHSKFEKTEAPAFAHQYLIALNEIPAEMIRKNDQYSIWDIFQNYLQVQTQGKYTVLYLFGAQNLQTCLNLYHVIKAYSADIYYADICSKTYYGDRLCSSGVKCIKDVTVNDISQICTQETRKYNMSVAFID